MSLKCLFGHKWNDSCKCERCGATRDEWHKRVLLEGKCYEKCSICGKERGVAHTWKGCKCERCGKIKDENHNWIPMEGKCIEKCSNCGKERTIEHNYATVKGKCIEKCSNCGIEHTINHDVSNSLKCKRCGQATMYAEMNGAYLPRLNDPFIVNSLVWRSYKWEEGHFWNNMGDEEIMKKLAGESEWKKYGFYPSEGLVGEIFGYVKNDSIRSKWNLCYILKIQNKYYVPVLPEDLIFMTETEMRQKATKEI